jgi:hypothetical protein
MTKLHDVHVAVLYGHNGSTKGELHSVSLSYWRVRSSTYGDAGVLIDESTCMLP